MIQASQLRALTMRLEGGREGQGKISGLEEQDQNEAQQQIETLQIKVGEHSHGDWQ